MSEMEWQKQVLRESGYRRCIVLHGIRLHRNVCGWIRIHRNVCGWSIVISRKP